jgi:antagonist of KipI
MIRVLGRGLLATVQDLGRWGYQRNGVSPSGAMDSVSHRVANVLVGNDENAATLEITLVGPALEFETDALVAICGGDLSPRISDLPVPGWRAVYVKRGPTLTFHDPAWGSRAYLAVGGGFDVPMSMGSRSTYLRAGIGGVKGNALSKGDRLAIGRPSEATLHTMERASARLGPIPFAMSERALDPVRLGYHQLSRRVRVTRGPQFQMFDDGDQRVLLGESFTVSEHSDRMGYRLSGHLLRSGSGADIISQAVLHGTIQVPPGGEPIALMADRQTVGGYPIVAQVISCDLPTMAQLKPGDQVRFEAVSVEKAQAALSLRESRLQSMLEEVSNGAAG